MKKLLFLLLLISSYDVYAQNTIYIPDVATKLSQQGLAMGATSTTSTTGWISTAYNPLYPPLTLPQNAVYILRLHIEKSGRETTTQLYYIGIDGMQSIHSDAPPLTPFLTFQTSGTANPALKVRYRKPQGAYEAGTWGIEATVLSSDYEGGSLQYSLTPLLRP